MRTNPGGPTDYCWKAKRCKSNIRLRQSSLSQPFSACAGARRKGFEIETRPCEENTSSVDIIDTNGGGDEDSDFDLPTFDLISSLGI